MHVLSLLLLHPDCWLENISSIYPTSMFFGLMMLRLMVFDSYFRHIDGIEGNSWRLIATNYLFRYLIIDGCHEHPSYSMYVCMYVCMYIYIICIYILFIYTYIYIYIYTYISMISERPSTTCWNMFEIPKSGEIL